VSAGVLGLPRARGQGFNDNGEVAFYVNTTLAKPIGNALLGYATAINKKPLGNGNMVTLTTDELDVVFARR
jgi:hypothetical protein